MTREKLETEESQDLGHRKTIKTHVTLYGNGLIVTESETASRHPTEGLRAELFVILVDSNGNAIWVTKAYKCTTRGSRYDAFTPSRGSDAFSENIPEEIAECTSSLDVVHYDDSIADLRSKTIEALKKGTEVGQAVKEAWKNLQ